MAALTHDYHMAPHCYHVTGLYMLTHCHPLPHQRTQITFQQDLAVSLPGAVTMIQLSHAAGDT